MVAKATSNRAPGRPTAPAATGKTPSLGTRHVHPLGDRVVVRPSPHEEMTSSGIVIPDTVKEKPQEGTVLEVGPGRLLDSGKREPIDVKVGSKVLYAKYAGTEFTLEGDDLLILGQKDILAIVER